MIIKLAVIKFTIIYKHFNMLKIRNYSFDKYRPHLLKRYKLDMYEIEN